MVRILASCAVFAAIAVALSVAAPAPQEPEVKLVRYENDNSGIDGYHFTYELDNGQIFSEAGALREVAPADGTGEKVPVIVVSGQYSFVGQDGITYWVNYTADENGYHPVVGTGEGGIKPGQDAAAPQ